MKKIYLFIAFTLICLMGNATNYFVDAVNGNNANSGLNAAQAFKTIPTAAILTNAGDTVFIMNGMYPNFTISRPGSALGQIVYTNYPGSTPKFPSTSGTYGIITVSPGANYITINGLELIGYGVSLSLGADTAAAQAAVVCPVTGSPATSTTFIPKYNGSGFIVGNNSTTTGTHHVIISNNIVHDCAAAGMGFGNCDYITVEGNTVYNNSWYTPYGTSGISFGYSYNYDTNTTTYRSIVRNNICYGNRLYVLWHTSCTISDGNGIILDVPQTNYNGRTLVANNICYNNGGSGIHTLSTNHVDFYNNVAYLNSASPENKGGAIYAYGADDVKFYNNILVSRPGKTVNNSTNATNIIYDYNIYYGGTAPAFVGPHSLIQDPGFVNPSTDPAVADFHPQQGSLAVNNGDNAHASTTDRDGTGRPVAATVDIGAYESAYTGNINTCNGAATQAKIVGNGNGTGEGSASTLYGLCDSKPSQNSQKSRKAMVYPAALLPGIPVNATINSLQFRRAVQTSPTNSTPGTQTVPDNSIMNVYVRNEASDNLGAAAFDWTSILPGAANPAVLVYAGEAGTIIGNAGGWKTIPFQVPFTYAGNSLGVYVEYLQKGVIASAPDINWIYDNGGSQPLYNTTTNPQMVNGYKFTGSTGTISNSLATTNERRPVVTVVYCADALLPVTLQQFNAVQKTGGVYISWLAGNEINNAVFEVQRSANGISFETIGSVYAKAAGVANTTTTINAYDFTDVKPLSSTGYYRLLQKDKDGKRTYSSIVVITNTARQLNTISTYPNPVSDKLNAVVTSALSQLAAISIRDLSGRVINRFSKQLAAGYNNIEINVSGQAASAYLLIIELPSGERLISRFVKK